MENSQSAIIRQLMERVTKQFPDDGSGHDSSHILRVYHMAKTLAAAEHADVFVVSLAALLHDAGDYKMAADKNEHHETAIVKLTLGLNIPSDVLRNVVHIVSNVSFKGNFVPDQPLEIEGSCVRDADRLDAMGAIGVARAFAYGALHSRPMYDVEVEPAQHHHFDDYKKNSGPTLNHFYEKLLLLKDRMETQTAKELAQQRHEFLIGFLKQFADEVNMNIIQRHE